MSKPSTTKRFTRLLLGGLLGIPIGLILAAQKIKLGPGDMLLMILLLALALYLQVFLHELGHLVLGRLSGFRLYSFRVYRLILERDIDRFRLRFRKNKGYAGLCMMVPVREISRRDSILYYSGGLLMHLLSILLCYILLRVAAPGNFPAYFFVLANLFMALLLVVSNAIPYKTKNNNRTDGYHIWHALRDTPSYQYQQRLFLMSRQLMSGIRPAELSEHRWEDAATFPDQVSKINFLVMAYYHFLDAGNRDLALSYLMQAEALQDQCTAVSKSALQLELLYAAAALQQDKEKADTLYASVKEALQKESTLTHYRVHAAYLLYIKGDLARAQQQTDLAMARVDTYFIKGMIPFETDLLKAMQSDISR